MSNRLNKINSYKCFVCRETFLMEELQGVNGMSDERFCDECLNDVIEEQENYEEFLNN